MSNPLDYVLDTGENVAVTMLDPAYNVMEYEAVSLTPLASLTDKELEEVLGVQEGSQICWFDVTPFRIGYLPL